MRITCSYRQIVNQQTLEVLKRSINKTIADAAPHIQAAKEKQMKILSSKLIQFNDWYMRITGLDKDQLLQIQEKRRSVGSQLAEVRQRSIDLQDELHKVKRQEDLERFLELMKKETEVLKLEKSIANTFQQYDQTERELFTAFSDSIRDSHEKQRAQMEYTKYFGFVLSIAGSFLAFVYSTLRKEQLKQIIDERLKKVTELNVNMMNTMLANRSTLDKFDDRVTNILTQLSNYNRINVDTVRNDATSPSEADTFLNLNNTYLQVAGILLGLWLISKALSG
ncbi:hypothetical protein HUJ05_006763 [Dendroctonus ponderosae]|nr:hypothetical protein HUJ05_006763 [Dendroctonus ponderosae]